MKRTITLIVMLCIIGMANLAVAQEVKINNDFNVGSDGTVTLSNNATTWNDLVVNPSTARNNGANVPTWTLFVSPSIFTWAFADAALSEVTFTVQLPHNYKEGSTIYPHVHWSSTTAAGLNRVRWVLEYQWVNLHSAFTATTITSKSGFSIVDQSRSVAAYEHAITPLNAGGTGDGIVGTGKTISSVLVCRLYRDGGNSEDSFSGVASLLSIDFHYEIDAFGSSLEFNK